MYLQCGPIGWVVLCWNLKEPVRLQASAWWELQGCRSQEGTLAQFWVDQLTLLNQAGQIIPTHFCVPPPPDFLTFLQPGVDLAKKLTGAATAASQLLVCKHHWQLYGAGKSQLQSSKFWAKKTLIHWHPSFSFDFAMAGWLYFLVSVAKFLASTILYVKCEKITGNKLHFVPVCIKISQATVGKMF